MLYNGQMMDYEMDQQGSNHLHPDTCIILGGVTNFLQPNIHPIMPASGGTTTFDVHHLPEHYEGAIYYGMAPYNSVQHHQPAANLDLSVAAASNYYNSYMTPSSGFGPFPSSINHGSSDQLPSSSNHGVIGVSTDDYGRNNYFMDAVRGSGKRKNAEGFPGNFQYLNASASSSSSAAPLNSSHPEYGVTVMDAESLSRLQYSGTGSPAIVEVGPHRGVRGRSSGIGIESVMPHTHNHLVHGNYMGAMQRAGSLWPDQQPGINSGDGSTLAWNQAPAVTYLNGSNVTGMETGNMCLQGYHEAPNNRGSTTYMHPPPFRHRHQNFNHPPPPLIQGVRGQNINFHPQMAASTYRHPTNNTSRSMMNASHESVETASRHVGPVPPTGIRIIRPHHGGAAPEATSRHRNLPYLRVLPSEEVAMLEIPDFYEVGNYIDHHRDMRLDIEDMSYEELLALGERIGDVKTGLSDEHIRSNLKTRTYLSAASGINLEEEPCMDLETDVCIICQCDYENRDKIGTLDCGHEYHAGCLKKWLLVKNVCPICKSPALTIE